MPNNTPITPPRVPLIDPRTGLIDRAWYLFFLSMFNAAQEVYEGDKAPNVDSLSASYDAALQTLAQAVEVQPSQPELGTLAVVNQDNVSYLGFTTPPPWVGSDAGQFWFNPTTNQLNIQQSASDPQLVGEQVFYYVRASSDIIKGQVVVPTGTDSAASCFTAEPAPLGLVATDTVLGIAAEDILTGEFGRITFFGPIYGLTTFPGFADGDIIYYDPLVVGGYTNVQPSAPALQIQVGVIIKAASGTDGSIHVRLQVAGDSGTFTAGSGETVTVVNGITISIT
jgi:hypothetical protein